MRKKPIITENGELTLSVIPLAKEVNGQGVVFGGWTLSQLDLAGAVPARRICSQTNEKVVTKAINHVEFISPVYIGDKVDFYTEVDRVGKTSISIHIEVIAERYKNGEFEKVAEAEFVYVRLPKD